MKRGTPDHPKTHALAAALGIERWGAVGILESLWHFAAAYAHAGDIGRHSDVAIARAIGWTGDPGTLIRALEETRWVEKCSCHGLRVHDWPDHADQTVERVLSKSGRGFMPCYDDASTVLAPNYGPAGLPSPSPSPSPSPLPSPLPPAEAAGDRKPKRKRPVAEVPEDLDPEQKVALLAWVKAKHPTEEPRIREHVDACLDHHRKTSNRAGITDWVAACRTWIRNAERFRPAHGPRAKQEERAALLAENVQAALRLSEERERRERQAASVGGVDPDVRRLRPVADA